MALLVLGPGCAGMAPAASSAGPPRPAFWVDAMRAEPLTFEALLDELGQARVIYLGEYHTLARHHELQTAILDGLARRGGRLALALEPFEFPVQPVLDQFNQKAIDLDQLVAASNWSQRWRGHTNYHALLAAARAHDVPLLALNARSETIRAVGRLGLKGIGPEQRAELPVEMVTDDPVYERLTTRMLGVHMAFDPEKLRPVFEAQVARDETMADRLAGFLQSSAGQGRTVIVICGRGHCAYGLGMPDRVARRAPELPQRVVLFSESGDLYLSPEERRQAREIEVPHEFLRGLGRSAADFFHVTAGASR